MKKSFKLILITLIILISLICIVSIFLCVFNNTDEYIKTQLDENGNRYLIYNDDKYFRLEPHGTFYSVSPDINGTIIGYTRLKSLKKMDVILLSGSDNIIVTNHGLTIERLWVKEGFNLPEVWEAEIGSVEYRREGESLDVRHCFWSNYQEKLTLNCLVDKDKCLDHIDNMINDKIIYFKLLDIYNLEIIMTIWKTDEDLYLRYQENFDLIYYPLKEEFKNLFMPLLEEQN